jgi:hypothetical protein
MWRTSTPTTTCSQSDSIASDRVVFREPRLCEVLELDGRCLDRVRLPDFLYPPAIKRNAVWAATTDANGAPT